MFDELRLDILELYRMRESSKFTDDEKEELWLIIKNLRTRLEQLEVNYTEVNQKIWDYVENTKNLLRHRVPNYEIKKDK